MWLLRKTMLKIGRLGGCWWYAALKFGYGRFFVHSACPHHQKQAMGALATENGKDEGWGGCIRKWGEISAEMTPGKQF